MQHNLICELGKYESKLSIHHFSIDFVWVTSFHNSWNANYWCFWTTYSTFNLFSRCPYTTLYYPPTEVPPPNYAKQPIVTNLSPANDTVIATNNCCFKFIFDLGGNKQLSSYHSWTSIIQSKLDVEQCYD